MRETKRYTTIEPLSELFTRKTIQKFANVLAKLSLALSLSYYRPITFLLYRIDKPTMVAST